MKDVARQAGVSVGTVSNVLNRPELVAPLTRDRVREAINQLGYVRSENARQLRAGQSRVILWSWYGFVTAVALLAAYLLMMLQAKNMASLLAVGWQYLATIILYPFAHRLIERFEDADVRFR